MAKEETEETELRLYVENFVTRVGNRGGVFFRTSLTCWAGAAERRKLASSLPPFYSAPPLSILAFIVEQEKRRKFRCCGWCKQPKAEGGRERSWFRLLPFLSPSLSAMAMASILSFLLLSILSHFILIGTRVILEGGEGRRLHKGIRHSQNEERTDRVEDEKKTETGKVWLSPAGVKMNANSVFVQ